MAKVLQSIDSANGGRKVIWFRLRTNGVYEGGWGSLVQPSPRVSRKSKVSDVMAPGCKQSLEFEEAVQPQLQTPDPTPSWPKI